MPRTIQNSLTAFAVLAVGYFLITLVLRPDPGGSYFSRAQNFEANGLAGEAIRHYLLIAETQPKSFYAPRALVRAADLKTDAARETNDKNGYIAARDLYTRVADNYPKDPLAVEALMSAASICADSLGDRKCAREYYQRILKDFAEPDSDLSATARVKIGKLAFQDGDAKTAIGLLQPVADAGDQFRTQPAEAQFLLGNVYETLMKDKNGARRAYELVLAKFPQSSWANDARERLGLMFFSASRGQIPPRRVMLNVDSLPEAGPATGTLWSTLKTLLASRGLPTDENTLQGWSLRPFYVGYDPANPSKVVDVTLDAFENVVANAGLRYAAVGANDEGTALRNLQDSIDAAHSPVVFFQDGEKKHWALAVGYDSSQNLVLLQEQGNRVESVPSKTFLGQWKVSSSFGKKFTLLDFETLGQKTPKPSLTPAPNAAGPGLDSTPRFNWDLSALSGKNVHRRTVQRAGTLLRQTRFGSALANAAGLDSVSTTLIALSQLPSASAIPTPIPNSDGEPGEEASPYEPTPSPAENRKLDARELAKARATLSFLGEPAREWAARRQEAAAYLDSAARVLGDTKVKEAAKALRLSASKLTAAMAQAPAADDLGSTMSPEFQAVLRTIGQNVAEARDAERRAAELLP